MEEKKEKKNTSKKIEKKEKEINQEIPKIKEKKEKKEKKIDQGIPEINVLDPIWLSVSESAKIGGVTSKTIRRAIQEKKIRYKIHHNRYLIDLASVVIYLNTNKKLKNKLLKHGIGQYIEKWKEKD